jgi:hypothetical protein
MARVYFSLRFDEALLEDHLRRLIDADGEEREDLINDLIESGVGFPVDRLVDLRPMERQCLRYLREYFTDLTLCVDGYNENGDLWLWLECPDFAAFDGIRNLFQPGCRIDAGLPLWLAEGLLLDRFPNDPDGHLRAISTVNWDDVTEEVFNGEEDI